MAMSSELHVIPSKPARSWRTLALLLASLLAVGACSTPPPSPPSTIAPDGQAYQPGVSAIYCYRTLAGADCFREMQPGPPNRLINGWPDLPPATTSQQEQQTPRSLLRQTE